MGNYEKMLAERIRRRRGGSHSATTFHAHVKEPGPRQAWPNLSPLRFTDEDGKPMNTWNLSDMPPPDLAEDEEEERLNRAPVIRGRARSLLDELYESISDITSAPPEVCWKMLLEIMANESGVWMQHGGTISPATRGVYMSLRGSYLTRLLREYLISLRREMEEAQREGGPIIDPVGQLLEDKTAEPGQLFTPTATVRIEALGQGLDDRTPHDFRAAADLPKKKVFDASCGTSRTLIDALVYGRDTIAFGVDLDIWMVRASIVNYRYLSTYTTSFYPDPAEKTGRAGLDDGARDELLQIGMPHPSIEMRNGGCVVMGGRSMVLWGNAQMIDTLHPWNWGFHDMWSPPRWEEMLKAANYNGTVAQWRAANRKEAERRDEEAAERKGKLKYDFALDDTLFDDGIRSVTERR